MVTCPGGGGGFCHQGDQRGRNSNSINRKGVRTMMGQPFVISRKSFSGLSTFVLTTPAPPHTLKNDGTSAAAQSSSNKEGESDFKETSETCRILPTLFDLPFPFQSLLPSRPNKRMQHLNAAGPHYGATGVTAAMGCSTSAATALPDRRCARGRSASVSPSSGAISGSSESSDSFSQ